MIVSGTVTHFNETFGKPITPFGAGEGLSNSDTCIAILFVNQWE